MSVIDENIIEELKQLFEDLKKIHNGEEKQKDSGDMNQNPQATQTKVDNIIKRIDEIQINLPKDDVNYLKILAMKSSLLYEKGKLLLSLEDLEGSKQCLEDALEIISSYREDQQIYYLYLRVMNHLAYVISKQGDMPVAKEILDKITQVVDPEKMIIYSTEELFSGKEIPQTDAALKLHKLIINNLQMLGWICCKMGMDDEYALKQHMVLQQQLNFGDCDPVDWSTRCARIAVLHLSKMKWPIAKYHLSAAGSILDQLERDMIPHPELGKAQAELARGWIYYGIRLFEASKALESTKRCNFLFSDKIPTEDTTEEVQSVQQFQGIEIKLVDMPSTYVSNTEEARILFSQTHIWLKRARMFYTLRDFPYIYVNCILDLSELYRFLAYFEPDIESQYNIHKRRGDALEALSGILKDIRPQCYISVCIEILKELAEVHLELMGLNLKRIYNIQGLNKAEDFSKRMSAVSELHGKLDNVRTLMEEDAKADDCQENAVQNDIPTNFDHTNMDETNDDRNVSDAINS